MDVPLTPERIALLNSIPACEPRVVTKIRDGEKCAAFVAGVRYLGQHGLVECGRNLKASRWFASIDDCLGAHGTDGRGTEEFVRDEGICLRLTSHGQRAREQSWQQMMRDLRSHFNRFYKTLDATTAPSEGGGRRVINHLNAIALSDETAALHAGLGAAQCVVFARHAVAIRGYPPGFVVMESDSPDGPFTPVPSEAVECSVMTVGGDGVDATLMAALQDAIETTALPAQASSASQAHNPGGNRRRWKGGDILSADDLAKLDAVRRKLAMITNDDATSDGSQTLRPSVVDRRQGGSPATDTQPTSLATQALKDVRQPTEKKLSPSRVRAAALYDWATARIPHAHELTILELFHDIREKLDQQIAVTPSGAGELDKLRDLRDSLPPNAEAFGKYLRDAGINHRARRGY